MTKNQSILVAAISAHETGYWTSKNFLEKNNLGGLWNGRQGTFYSYESFEVGLDVMIDLLKNDYFNNGLTTIRTIGEVYCPEGAANDPYNQNQHWIPKVTLIYNQYLGLQK